MIDHKQDEAKAKEEIKEKLSKAAPKAHGTTKTSATGGVAKMTDTSKYTGSHKERFDAEGKGKVRMDARTRSRPPATWATTRARAPSTRNRLRSYLCVPSCMTRVSDVMRDQPCSRSSRQSEMTSVLSNYSLYFKSPSIF